MKTKTLQKWVKALVGLQDGKEVTCPNCESHNLDYGYVRTIPNDNVGFGAVWCKDCNHAFHVSRVEVNNNEQHMVSDLPKNLIFA